MYGIPNMKLDKGVVQRRDRFARGGRSRVCHVRPCWPAGRFPERAHDANHAGARLPGAIHRSRISFWRNTTRCCLATGATKSFDPTARCPGRELKGIHLAMDFLTRNTKSLLDDNLRERALHFRQGARCHRHRRRRHGGRLHRHVAPPWLQEHDELRAARSAAGRPGGQQPVAGVAADLSRRLFARGNEGQIWPRSARVQHPHEGVRGRWQRPREGHQDGRSSIGRSRARKRRSAKCPAAKKFGRPIWCCWPPAFSGRNSQSARCWASNRNGRAAIGRL